MKVGIVVPFSWSFWGGINEHAYHQARALERLGVETRTIMGHDPRGRLTHLLHPREGRHDRPPPDVIPVGRSVIIPANESLPNIVLSPSAIWRLRGVLERERFDVLHLHEPMTPVLCVAALVFARCPVVSTHHAAGELGWHKPGNPLWGFLMDRIDHRIAVSEQARRSVVRWHPGDYEVIPNGVEIPERAAGERQHHVVFIGRHDPRKGLDVLLRAWPAIRRRTGARLRLIGADPLAVRLLLTRSRVSDEGIDILGFLSSEERTRELLTAKVFVSPATGQESFGLVLIEAFACGTPVVASDIPGYRAVMTPETGVPVPPGDPVALADAVTVLLGDDVRRHALGSAARELVLARYSWDDIGRRLVEESYERLTSVPAALPAAAR